MCCVIVVLGQCIVVGFVYCAMEEKLGSFCQGRESSWFVSGMGVPGGMLVEPGGLAGAQGRDTFAWEGFTTDKGDQLCGSSSPLSPPGCAGEVEVSLPQGCNGQLGINMHGMWGLYRGILY